MECLNLDGVKNEEVNSKIKEKLSQNNKILIQNANSMHNICAGLTGNYEVVVEDSTGLYTASYLEGPTVRVMGNAGWYAGDDMMSGTLLIEKNTGCNIGAYICGGDIVIYGSTGSRAGYGMKGGHIIVCGSAGRWAGQMAMGGNLIVFGTIGQEIGESMYKGKIFTRDPEAGEKLGGNVFYDEITEEEARELDELFEKYQIKGKGEEFHVVRPVLTGRHVYKLFEPELKPDLAKKYRIKEG